MMSTNLAKLRKGKGAPPAADTTSDVIIGDSRSGKAPLRPLQVRIPAQVFEEFSETAGREFGFTHGAKKQLFLKMWELYRSR